LTDEGPITLGATNISDENKLDLSNLTYITYKKFNESPEIKVNIFDIILVQRGSIGKVAIIDRDIREATINPSIILIKKLRIMPFFLYYILTDDKIQSQIDSILSQTGVPMISQSQAKQLILHIPLSKSEQRRIAQILSQIDKTIEKEQEHKQKLERIKQGLMEDLLTGKVRVNHLIKEEEKNVQTA
jgi:type I restriction enzyme S subunit